MSVATLERPQYEPKVSAGGSGRKPPFTAVVASGTPDFNNERRRVYES